MRGNVGQTAFKELEIPVRAETGYLTVWHVSSRKRSLTRR